MDKKTFEELIKKMAKENNLEKKEPTYEELLENEAYVLINPISMAMNKAIIETIVDFGVEIVYRATTNEIYLLNNETKSATRLDKFLEVYSLLLEDFIITSLKRDFESNGKKLNMKSKIEIKTEERVEEIKALVGEENFNKIDGYLRKKAEANYERDSQISDEVLKAKDKKMC